MSERMALWNQPTFTFTHIGWPLHEFGHLIGFYDEYGSKGQGTELYNYCIMGDAHFTGPTRKGECPASLSPYYRAEIGWVNPIVINRDTTNFSVYYDYNNPKFYRINPINRNVLADEHFIFETRLRKGFDTYLPTIPDSFSTQPGVLLIWHHNSPSDYSAWNIYDHVRLINADDTRNSRSYRTDFFPRDASTNRQSFNDITIPQARHDYITSGGYFTDIRPAHFALNGIRRINTSNPLLTDYTIIDTIALRLTLAAGIITENTAWSYNVRIVDDVTVQNGVTLKINPGTQVVFENQKSLTINGKLISKGDQNNRITFTSANQSPSPGDWGGIVFSGGGPDTLTYCNIKYAENGLRFLNTAPNSYMAYDTVSNSSGFGVSVSSTGASSTALRIYKSAIRNNRTEELRINFARVNVSNSRIEKNGAGAGNSGIFITNAGRLFLDSSFVTNNIGSGIDVSGNGSRVSLSPDEIKRGYNTVTGHGLSEIYVRNSASALLGYRATINYCICEEDPLDKLVDQFNEGSEIVSKSPDCPPGCFPAVRYESRAGWNNVTNNFTYNCRLINNATAITVQARYNYWGTGSSMFCGPVDTLSQLGSPVNTPAKLENTDMYVEEQFSKEDRTRMREWLIQLKSDIELNNTNSIDALYQLALYVGPGGEYSDALEMPWEFLLTSVERNSRLSNVKSLASVFLITAKMDREEFSNAIYIADQILRRNNDDNMWFFCQTQKVIANVGLGNITNAISLFNAMKSRGEKIDKKSIEVLEDYLKNVSSTTNSNVKMSDNNIQTVQKINIEDSNIERPKTYSLDQCYPNPFNPVTQIKFSIPEAGFVTLRVYDVLGREVATLMDEFKESGYYEIEFNGSSLSSGVYFYRLVVSNYTAVKKLLITK